jgi:hypothetical protein
METIEIKVLDRLHSVYSNHPSQEQVSKFLAELRDPNPPRILKPMPGWTYSLMQEIQRELPELYAQGLPYDLFADLIELVYVLKVLESKQA